jgi:hypothetical protein
MPNTIQLVQALEGGGTTTFTLNNPSTKGNFYLVWILGNTATSITDNASPPNTYVFISDTNGSGSPLSLYYAEDINVPSSGPTTFTANTGGGGVFFGVLEYSGVSWNAGIDQQATASGSTTSVSSGNMTPSVNGELVYGVVIIGGGGGNVFTPGTGFVVANSNFGNNWYDIDQILVGGSGTPLAVNGTLSSASAWGCIAATFEPGGPTITSQPTGGTIYVNGSITLSVTATATSGSLTYQWQLNGVNISGATSSSYTAINPAQINQNGAYTCIVTDSSGTVTSNVAQVNVLWNPGGGLGIPTIGQVANGEIPSSGVTPTSNVILDSSNF